MRLLGLLVVIAVFCVAHNPFKFIPLSLDPSDGPPWIVNPLALLLREQYAKTLSIFSTHNSPFKNTSSYSRRQSDQLINIAIDNRGLVNNANGDKNTTPNQLIIDSPNSLSPVSTSPAASDSYHTNSPSTSSIAQLSDSTTGTNGTSTAGNSASATLNALGALLVFVGAAFALL